MTVQEQVNQILNHLLGTHREYTPDAQLLGTGCLLDSLLATRLVAEVDSVFSIDLLEDDWTLEALETVGSLIRCIQGKQEIAE